MIQAYSDDESTVKPKVDCSAVQKVMAVCVFSAAGLNTYPPVTMKKTCQLINNQQEGVKNGYACYCNSQ